MKFFTRLVIALIITNCSSSMLFAQKNISLQYGSTQNFSQKTELPNVGGLILSVSSLKDSITVDSFLSRSIVRRKATLPALNKSDTLKNLLPKTLKGLNYDAAKKAIVQLNLNNYLSIGSLKPGDSVIISTFLGKTIKPDTFWYNITAAAQAPTVDTPISTSNITFSDYENYIRQHYPELKKTDVGYRDETNDKLPGETSSSERYYTVHVFFDESGNSLLGSIPSGIQRKYHYMVHVLSWSNKHCSITVKSGDLVDSAVFYNMGASVSNTFEGQEPNKPKTRPITEYAFNTFPTTSDLVFELNIRDSATNQSITKTYTIKKSPFYIGAFNAGVVYSWLKNPSYQLVNSPVNAGMQTVKAEHNSSTGVMVTAMYTVYWSPVNALSALFNPDDHRFSPWGRSYLDDGGSFLRKIYPCVGLGLKDQVFTNFIAGLNCEPMQGFGIFVGANIRQVNTFDMPDFTAGVTDVTQDQFNYYQNTKWKAGFTLGIELDISIFNKLVGSISTSAK